MTRPLPMFLVFLAAACASEAKAPPAGQESSGAEAPQFTELPAPAPTPPPAPPPLPEPVEGTFALPVRIPLSAIAALIDAELPEHEAQPYQALTRAGSSPEVSARFEFWRDPVSVRFEDSALVVEVPIRYAGQFDARVKNPLGGNWMTVAKQEPWGTAQDPLRATLRLRTRVDVSPQWTLALRTTIEAPVHGPPPEGKICTGGSFRLCVPKSSVAPQVQSRMNVELQTRVRDAVANFERNTVRTLALRTQVSAIFRDLVQPRPAEHNRWMTLEPSGAALSMYEDGSDIVFEPAVAARLSYHEQQPPTATPPLPDRTPLAELPSQRLDLPEAFVPAELKMLLATP